MDNHMKAFANKVLKGVMVDYTEESVMWYPLGSIRGLDEIAAFFTSVFENPLPGFFEDSKVERLDIESEIIFYVWSGGDMMRFGTDTFVVRNRKILYQTFAGYMNILQ